MGVIERRVSDAGCSPSELAIAAAEQAIANYDGRIDEIDAVIFCGIERDQPEPATAHEIQKNWEYQLALHSISVMLVLVFLMLYALHLV